MSGSISRRLMVAITHWPGMSQMSVRVPDLLVMILYAGEPFEYNVTSITLFLSKTKERLPHAGVVEVLAMDSDSI